MGQDKPRIEIAVAGPVTIGSVVCGNSLDTTVPRHPSLEHSADALTRQCEFSFKPDLPRNSSSHDARTIIYVMWEGFVCQSYGTEFAGRQQPSKYYGKQANATVAFFDVNTMALIEALKFYGSPPPEKGMVFSGTAAYRTGEVLGDLPKIAFTTRSDGEDRYAVCASAEAKRRLFTKRWRISKCEECGSVTPHVESWVGLFFKRIFSGLKPSQRCLVCGTVRKG